MPKIYKASENPKIAAHPYITSALDTLYMLCLFNIFKFLFLNYIICSFSEFDVF